MVHSMRPSKSVQKFGSRTLFLGMLLLGGTVALSGPSPVFAQEPATAVRQDAGPKEPAEFYPAVSLLPPTTQGFIEFQDVPNLLDRWEKTSLAGLQHDPAMQPFIESQRDAIEAKLSEVGVRIGFKLSDLRDAVSGEVVLAWMRFEDPQRPFAVAMLADTRGRDAQREAMLKKVDSGLREREATVTSMSVRGFPVTVYTLPRKKGQLIVERFGVVTVNGRVIVSDRTETLAGLVSAAIDGRRDGVMQIEEYRGVFERAELSAVNEADGPHVRWFARPIDMGMIIRELVGVDRGNEVDILQLLQDQGFDAVRSVGGRLFLATENYDLLHRGFVFAPPTGTGGERYLGAAKMLDFPQTNMDPPPSWVLADAATYLKINWKLGPAFWASEVLVNAAFDSDVFRTTLEGLRTEEKGVQLDIAGDIVKYLDDHVIVITDNRRVEERTQERVLAALKLTDAEHVREALAESLPRDPEIERLDVPGQYVWEVRNNEAASEDQIIFDVDLGFESEDLGDPIEDPTEPVLENMGIAVYDGYLIFASHSELLLELIENGEKGEAKFSDLEAYQRVRQAIEREGGELRAMERIVRTDISWRIKYDLLRGKNFLESDSLLASLIRRGIEKSEQAEPAKEVQPEEIDLSTLPPYAQVSDYLQPGGGFVTSESTGWRLTQFLLRKPEE